MPRFLVTGSAGLHLQLRMHLLSLLCHRDGDDLSELRRRTFASAEAPRQAMSPAGTPLWIDEVASPVGTILLVARDGILVGADFADCRHRLMGLLGARYEILDLRSAVDPFGFSARIQAYLAGDLDATSDISVDPGGTP